MILIMKIENTTIIYALMNLLCGIISCLILNAIWYYLSKTFIEIFILAIIPIMECWGLAGIISWGILKTSKYLAICSFALASILFGLLCLVTSVLSSFDSSVSAWLIVIFIGYLICSFPSYLFLKFIVVPKLINCRIKKKNGNN